METSLRTQEQSETPEAIDTARLRYIGEETHKLCYPSNMLFSAKCLLVDWPWSVSLTCSWQLVVQNADTIKTDIFPSSTANISNPGIVPPQLQVSTS